MKMVKDLIGAELDYWVGRAEGENCKIQRVTMGVLRRGVEGRRVTYSADDYDRAFPFVDEDRCLRIYKGFDGKERGGFWLNYSRNHALAGPIIDRMRISTKWSPEHQVWVASSNPETSPIEWPEMDEHAERLVAAMRVCVRDRFGEDVGP